MKGCPKYKYGDKVTFNLQDDVKVTGTVYIIDAYGTFEDPSDVSYDILTDDCLYKHITEGLIYESND